ncbi:MAG: DUF1565 domain-containing protein, partial [Nitrospirae bacterium]|nr:DUF1565 domain-containing protein [Candidatus Manganitrophaceae bacterium]
MFNRSASRLGFYALLPLLMVFSACSGGNSGAGSEPMASVGIKLAPVNNGTAQSKSERRAPKTENITLLTIDVQDADGNELARESANVEPGTTVTLTLNVPVGVNRIFKAEASDEAGQVILFGNVVTDLQEDVPVVLTIPVEAPLLISPENPVIDTDATQTFTATRSPLLSDALQWTVDGILNGDAQVGTITAIDDLSAEYTAPASVPGAAQVDVRVESTLDPELYFDETQAMINDPAKTLFVDPINGVDSDTCGAEADKCKTLTQALFLAEAGGTVLLEPGTYFFDDGPENETLPLQMKTGVTIHGTTQHGIAFLDFTDPEISGPRILGADGATLSGLGLETNPFFGPLIETNGTSPTIQDNLFFGGCDLSTDNCNSTAIFVDQSSAPNIFGNTFGEIEGPRSFFSAVHLEGQATPQIIDNDFMGNGMALLIQGDAAPQIIDNDFTGNGVALLIQDDAEPRIENNRILENREGVVVEDNALPDLGGGTLGSVGLNILSCNSEVDLFNDTFGEILAQTNQWDHDPPTDETFPGDGIDIVFSSGSVDASDATLYPFASCNLGIRVENQSGTATTENLGTVTFDVVLGTQPSKNVVIALKSSDEGEGTVSTDSLTFTPDNWNDAQDVTVTGVDDI